MTYKTLNKMEGTKDDKKVDKELGNELLNLQMKFKKVEQREKSLRE